MGLNESVVCRDTAQEVASEQQLTFIDLHEDVQEHIFHYCWIRELKNLSRTSSQYNKMLRKHLFHTVNVPLIHGDFFRHERKHDSRIIRSLSKRMNTWQESVVVLRGVASPLYTIPKSVYEVVSRLTALQELDLSWPFRRGFSVAGQPTSNVDDDVLRILCRGFLVQLKILNLSAAGITSGGCSYLSTLITLRKLVLSRCHNLKDDAIHHIANVTSLDALEINGIRNITDIGCSSFTKCVGIRELNISSCWGITAAGFAKVCTVTNLTALDISSVLLPPHACSTSKSSSIFFPVVPEISGLF